MLNKNNKLALSPMGIAIAIVCLLAVVMILSTPMIVDKYGNNSETTQQESMKKGEYPDENYETKNSEVPNPTEERLSQLSQRIDDVERFARDIQMQANKTTSDKSSYSCTIEGVVDENGNMIPASKVKTTTPDTKYVFVCGKK